MQAVGSFPASTRIFPSSGNLTVVNLSPLDHGVYECVAASVVSSVITTTLLIIERTYMYYALLDLSDVPVFYLIICLRSTCY